MKKLVLTNEQVQKIYEASESLSFQQGENASETINNAKEAALEEPERSADGKPIPVVITPNEPEEGAPTFNASTSETSDGDITQHLENGEQVSLTKEAVEKMRINKLLEHSEVFTKKDFNSILLK